MKEKILVTGGTGMIGKAIQGCVDHSLNKEYVFMSSKDCDLKNEQDVRDYFSSVCPTTVIHLAARVGGIKANYDFVADFFVENVKINTNVLETCKNIGVKKVLSVLSTCIYPDKVSYPITEEQLYLGFPHESNFGYAYSKRMLDVYSKALNRQYGCNYYTVVANNLFGKYDNFHYNDSHVIPAIIRKIYEAKINNEKEIMFWGDGSPKREFTYSIDFAKAILFTLQNYSGTDTINLGNTEEYTIKEVVYKIKELIGYEGDILWDSSYMNGQMKKNSSNKKFLSLGWKTENYTNFDIALEQTINWFKVQYPNLRGVL